MKAALSTALDGHADGSLRWCHHRRALLLLLLVRCWNHEHGSGICSGLEVWVACRVVRVCGKEKERRTKESER